VLPLMDKNPTRRFPILTVVLIAVNAAIFVFQLTKPGDYSLNSQTAFICEWGLVPDHLIHGPRGELPVVIPDAQPGDVTCEEINERHNRFLGLITSQFLHGGWFHLIFNMLFLWVFGNNIEDRLGPVRYLLFYVTAGVAATFTHVFLQPTSTIPVIGASGAIAGVMGAYLVWFPNAEVLSLLFIVVARIRAKWWLLIWFASQFLINPNEGVAWAAHVGGFVFGALLALVGRTRRQPAST
jgi:membrane associated rhomboid family serine protease